MGSVDPGAERLVGRGPELTQLLDALGRVRAGVGGGLALIGEAGVGKSRLARELLVASRSEQVPVLVGRAVATASAVPYRAVRESLLSWVRTRPVPAADSFGGYGRGVDHLLDDSGAEGQRLSPVFVAESYLRVLSAVGATTGCVVLLEDLHWADDETLAVVEYVADHAESAGVLLVVTSRYDAAAAARPLLDALSARGSVRALRLAPLDPVQVGELAAQLLGGPVSPALVDLLHQRSEGVPLLLEELVSALRLSHALTAGPAGAEASDAAARVLPGSVAETVRVRLDALPRPHRQVLETAAVFGRSFDWRRLAPVAGLDDDAVLESLRAATTAALLEPDPVRPGELRFRHALIRDAVSAATFPPERTLLARRALDELMATAGPEGRDEDLALAIELAAQCDDHATAATLALRLAWRAMMGWSLATAERRLAQARRHAETDRDLLLDIDVLQIRVASMVGRIDVVRTVGGALLARVDDSDPGTRLETHLQLGQVAAEDGDWAESERQLDAAAPLLARAADPCHLTRHALWSAVRAGQAGATDEARGHALRAIELAAPHEDQVDLTCAALLHLGRLALPDVDEALARWRHG
ncbi:MAG: ATP-binding protein, partial [Nocardioides sp.]